MISARTQGARALLIPVVTFLFLWFQNGDGQKTHCGNDCHHASREVANGSHRLLSRGTLARQALRYPK